MSIVDGLNQDALINDTYNNFIVKNIMNNAKVKDKHEVEQNNFTFYGDEFIKNRKLDRDKKPSFFNEELWSKYQSFFPWLYYSENRFLCSFCEEALKKSKKMILSNWALGNTVKIYPESIKGYNISKIRFERHSKTDNHLLAINILAQTSKLEDLISIKNNIIDNSCDFKCKADIINQKSENENDSHCPERNQNTVDNELVKIKKLINIKHVRPSFFCEELWSKYQICFPWLYYSENKFLCLFCEEALKQDKGMLISNWALGNTVKMNSETTRGYNISKIRFERHSKTHNHILAVDILSQAPESDYWTSLQTRYPWLVGDLLNIRCSLCDDTNQEVIDSIFVNTRTVSDFKNVKFSTIYRLDRHEKCKSHVFATNQEKLSKKNSLINSDIVPLVGCSSSDLDSCLENKRRRKSAPIKSLNDYNYVLPLAVSSQQFDELQSQFSWLNYCSESSFSCKLCPETNSQIVLGCDSSLGLISKILLAHCHSEIHDCSTRGDKNFRTTRLQLGVSTKVDYKRLSTGISDTSQSRAKAKVNEVRPWACPQCNSNFLRNVSLVEHISLCDYQSEDIVRQLSCPCNPFIYHFNTITKLDLHVAQEHGMQLLFHCYICSNRYSRLLSLYSHILVHHLIAWDPYESFKAGDSSVTPIKCIFCCKLLVSNADLTNHYCKSRCKQYLQPAVVLEEMVNNIKSVLKEENCTPVKLIRELKSKETIVPSRILSERRKTSKSSPRKRFSVLSTALLVRKKVKDLENTPNETVIKDYKNCKINLIPDLNRITTSPTNTVVFLENKKRIRFPTKKMKENTELNLGKRKLISENVTEKIIVVSDKRLSDIESISRNPSRTEKKKLKKNVLVKIKETLKVFDGLRKSSADKRKENNQNIIESTKLISNDEENLKLSKVTGKVSFMERMKSIRQMKKAKTEEKREEMKKVDKTFAEINDNPMCISAILAKSEKMLNEKLLNCSNYSMEHMKSILRKRTRKKTKMLTLESLRISKLGNFACDICEIKFRTLGARDKHVTVEHKGTRLFKCCLCETSVSTHLSLRKHAARFHMERVSYAVFGNENRVGRDFLYRCFYCRRTLINKQSMNHHVTSVHRHRETEGNEGGLSDSPVSVVFDDFIKRLITADPCSASGGLQCCRCQMSIDNEFEMAIHSVEHESDSNVLVNQYSCSKCNRLFFGANGKMYLKDHYNIYHLRKPYPSCEDCKSRFLSTWCYCEHRRLITHCSKRATPPLCIRDPYEPLNDPSRLAFLCNGCQCLVAGANAQMRFNEHQAHCVVSTEAHKFLV